MMAIANEMGLQDLQKAWWKEEMNWMKRWLLDLHKKKKVILTANFWNVKHKVNWPEDADEDGTWYDQDSPESGSEWL